jgi:hypothetical protein
MDVDHFKPKGKHRNLYSNLMLASRHCNGSKSDIWPTAEDVRSGLRLLNPCKEVDYGQHIFEDKKTYELGPVKVKGVQ